MDMHSGKQSLHDIAHNTMAVARSVDALAAEMKGIREVLEQIKDELIRKKD